MIETMNPRFVWPAFGLAAIAGVACAVMAIAHVPDQTIALIAALLFVPVLTAFVGGQLAEVKGQQNVVQQQTNGMNSRLLDIVEGYGKLLHLSTAPTVQNGQPTEPAPAAGPEQQAA